MSEVTSLTSTVPSALMSHAVSSRFRRPKILLIRAVASLASTLPSSFTSPSVLVGEMSRSHQPGALQYALRRFSGMVILSVPSISDTGFSALMMSVPCCTAVAVLLLPSPAKVPS